MPRIAVIVWLIAASGLLLSSSPAAAQAVDDAGLWTGIFGQGDFESAGCSTDKLKWWFDGQVRFLDDTHGFNQSLVRPGVGWSVTEKSALWVGYAWIVTEPVTGSTSDENRAWQQWTWSHDFDELKFSLRSRLEQRFLDTGDDMGLRFRQQARVEHKLPGFPSMSLIGWDEVFYNLNDTDWGAEAGFDQNRAFAGVGFSTDPNCRWRMEFGYLNQAVASSSGPDRVNHILSLNFNWR